jgi:hypothetical protein
MVEKEGRKEASCLHCAHISITTVQCMQRHSAKLVMNWRYLRLLDLCSPCHYSLWERRPSLSTVPTVLLLAMYTILLKLIN